MAMRRVPRRRRARRLRSAFVRLRFEYALFLPNFPYPNKPSIIQFPARGTRNRRATKPVGVFDASLVEWMLRSGNPDDALYYIECILQRAPVEYSVSSPLSYELIAQVGVFKTLAKVVAGGKEGDAVAELFANPSEYILRNPASVRLHKMIALMHADRTRASELWEILKPQALDAIIGLADRCPELQGEPRLPRERTSLCDAAPHRLLQCYGRRLKTTKRALSAALIHGSQRKKLGMIQGRKRSVHSSDASSQSAAKHMKIEENAPKPENHEAREFPSSASSSVALSTRSEQMAPKLINLAEFLSGASGSMMLNMKSEQKALKPINLAGVLSNVSSSSLVLDKQVEENAP